MRYGEVKRGRFLARPNRFVAHVELEGERVVCHVKNTGRCRELLTSGAAVYLERAENPARKTPYDLIAVEKGDLLINMDAQAPNKVFGEWAAAGRFLPGLTALRPEFTWEDSRFDFRLEDHLGPCFVEVKGVTLEQDGLALFPNDDTHPAFGQALREAAAAGVGVYAWDCAVTPESLTLDAPVEVAL